MRKRKTTDALAIIQERYYKGKPERQASLKMERENAKIALALYNLRKVKKLTQMQLARRVGTTASVISRLEKSNYTGHSLNMIQRVAASLQHRVDIKFVSTRQKRRKLACR